MGGCMHEFLASQSMWPQHWHLQFLAQKPPVVPIVFSRQRIDMPSCTGSALHNFYYDLNGIPWSCTVRSLHKTIHDEPRLHFSTYLNTQIVFIVISDLANPLLNKEDNFIFLQDKKIFWENLFYISLIPKIVLESLYLTRLVILKATLDPLLFNKWCQLFNRI